MKHLLLPPRAAGFTLLELLLVFAVVAVSVSVASAAYSPLLQKNRLQASAQQLLRALNLARSEAILRNSPVSVCPSDMHATGQPGCSGDFSGGWIVFSNADKDRVVDAQVDQVVQVYTALHRSIGLTNRAGTRPVSETIHYLPDGSSHRNQTLLLCSKLRPVQKGLSIVLNIVGRPRLESGWGTCPEVSA